MQVAYIYIFIFHTRSCEWNLNEIWKDAIRKSVFVWRSTSQRKCYWKLRFIPELKIYAILTNFIFLFVKKFIQL